MKRDKSIKIVLILLSSVKKYYHLEVNVKAVAQAFVEIARIQERVIVKTEVN